MANYAWLQWLLVIVGGFLLVLPVAIGFYRPYTLFRHHKGKMVFTYVVGLTLIVLGRHDYLTH